VSVHWDTVKRLLKRQGCSYRRARRVPPKVPVAATQAAAQRALAKLHRMEEQGRCKLLYGDECGFSLLPSVPYLWQPKGTRLCLPAHPHQKRLSVLGFWCSNASHNHLWSYPLRERLTAQHFMASIEALLEQLDPSTPSVLVLDNAPVHRAQCVQKKRVEWKQRGLRLFFLPPYCPHLNRIELLWRQIKYRWLEPQAYVDFSALCQSVTSILDGIGSIYRLSFA
jgi:hypothetical protein